MHAPAAPSHNADPSAAGNSDQTSASNPSLLRLLWIDDEPDYALSELLGDCGCHVEWATTGAAGFAQAHDGTFDVIVLDVRLDDMCGLSVLRRLVGAAPLTPVLIVTGCYLEEEVVQDARQFGAAAVAYKPFLDEHALAAALRVVADGWGASPLLVGTRDQPANSEAETAAHSSAIGQVTPTPPEFVAKSEAMRSVVTWIAGVAPTEATILLTGETGVGKTLIARAIHQASRRAHGPFVTVDCSTIPESILESELFGHRRGAFTGAANDKKGLVEEAHGGTLFLDEIGDVSPAAQSRLLSIVETGELRRVGETKTRRVDVRVITATNRRLRDDVAQRRFREDLYYRIAVLQRHIPPLRERPRDLEALVRLWVPRLARRHGRSGVSLTAEAVAALRAHDWPGNVRELRNVLEQAVCLATGAHITGLDLAAILSRTSSGDGRIHSAAPLHQVLSVLHQNGGNLTRAAKALGVNRTTLWRRLRRYRPRRGDMRD